MSNWIKCSERLPKEFESVLVYGIEEYNDPKSRFIAWRVGNHMSKRFYSNNGECGKVTHWQQLPEPPKEK